VLSVSLTYETDCGPVWYVLVSPSGLRILREIGCLLHVYLHREPHSSGPFDMQLVYEDMPQESGSYQCRATHFSTNG